MRSLLFSASLPELLEFYTVVALLSLGFPKISATVHLKWEKSQFRWSLILAYFIHELIIVFIYGYFILILASST